MTDFNREIRDDTIARLLPLSRYAPPARPGQPARIRRTPVMPPQEDDLPCLLVYLTGQRMTADGEANAGEPAFVHEAVLNISGVLPADSEDGLDDITAAAAMEILETLLEDAEWLGQFEAVTGIEQRIGFDTQNYLAAIVLTSITVTYRTTWQPRVPDAFGSVSLRTPDAKGADYPVST